MIDKLTEIKALKKNVAQVKENLENMTGEDLKELFLAHGRFSTNSSGQVYEVQVRYNNVVQVVLDAHSFRLSTQPYSEHDVYATCEIDEDDIEELFEAIVETYKDNLRLVLLG